MHKSPPPRLPYLCNSTILGSLWGEVDNNAIAKGLFADKTRVPTFDYYRLANLCFHGQIFPQLKDPPSRRVNLPWLKNCSGYKSFVFYYTAFPHRILILTNKLCAIVVAGPAPKLQGEGGLWSQRTVSRLESSQSACVAKMLVRDPESTLQRQKLLLPLRHSLRAKPDTGGQSEERRTRRKGQREMRAGIAPYHAKLVLLNTPRHFATPPHSLHHVLLEARHIVPRFGKPITTGGRGETVGKRKV